MDNDKQRIAIAEACGFSDFEAHSEWHENGDTDGFRDVLRATRNGDMGRGVPNYLHDLNAMHEAEKTLVHGNDCGQFFTYCDRMSQVLDSHKETHASLMAWRIHAPAYIRAEAFLRTIGKWEDSALSSRNPVPSPSSSIPPARDGASRDGDTYSQLLALARKPVCACDTGAPYNVCDSCAAAKILNQFEAEGKELLAAMTAAVADKREGKTD